jgi:hypothetical protein
MKKRHRFYFTTMIFFIFLPIQSCITFTNKETLDQSNMNRQIFPTTYIANGYVDI